MSTPVRVISFAPRSSSRWQASRTASNGSVWLAPRAFQMVQKVQRWSQPLWTAMKLFTRWRKPAGTGDVMASNADILPALPTTRATPGMAANASGSLPGLRLTTLIAVLLGWVALFRGLGQDASLVVLAATIVIPLSTLLVFANLAWANRAALRGVDAVPGG